jgi:hypothetical protein
MKWSNLIGFLVAALGIGTLCSCAPHSFGSGLRNIRNAMDFRPRGSFLALDVFAVLLIALSYFLYRARNWARLMLMGGCICYTVVAVVGGILLCIEDANIAGPLLLILVLRQPEVIKEFGGRMQQECEVGSTPG